MMEEIRHLEQADSVTGKPKSELFKLHWLYEFAGIHGAHRQYLVNKLCSFF